MRKPTPFVPKTVTDACLSAVPAVPDDDSDDASDTAPDATLERLGAFHNKSGDLWSF